MKQYSCITMYKIGVNHNKLKTYVYRYIYIYIYIQCLILKPKKNMCIL